MSAELSIPEPIPCPQGSLLVSAAAAETSAVRLSLAIPTYNEAANIGKLLELLVGLLDPELPGAYELIVIDDDSPDRTWEVALRLAARLPQVRVIRRQGEKGLSTAVIRAWQAARGEVLGVMDADLQHPPEANLLLWREMAKGADLAVASRHVQGGGVSDWSMIRRVLSRGAQLIGLLVLPAVVGRVTDPMSGFFMVRRDAVAGVRLNPIGYKILVEVLGRGRVRWIAEAGYVFRERTEGESKVTSKVYVHYLQHLLLLRLATLPSSRFFRFCVVGASGVLVDMGLLYLLSDPHALGLALTRSKLIAAECAIISNFLLNDAWTFGDVAKQQRGLAAKFRRLLGFNAVCSVGLFLNVLILNLLFNYAGTNRYLANAIAIVAVTGWNYWLNRKLNWSPLAAGAAGPPAGGDPA